MTSSAPATPARIRRTLIIVFAIVAILAGVFSASVLGVSAAHASDTDNDTVVTDGSAISGGRELDEPGGPSVTDPGDYDLGVTSFRSTNRWFSATNGFHSQFDGFIGSQIFDQANRNLISANAMSAGNLFQGWANDFTQFAVNLDFIDTMGSTIDGIARTLLEALFGTAGGAGSVLIAFVIIFAVVLILVRESKRGVAAVVKKLGALTLSLIITFGMVQQAQKAPASGAGYQPVVATPGWFVKSANDAISWLTAAPADAFMNTVDTRTWGSDLEELGGELGCHAFNVGMKRDLRGYWQDNGAGVAQVATANIMDAMWDTTGLFTWAKTQGGYDNPYIDKVYCRILDFRAAEEAYNSSNITARGADEWMYQNDVWNTDDYLNWADTINNDARARAPWVPGTNEDKTASIIAWAACEPTGLRGTTVQWKWTEGWADYYGGRENWLTEPRGVKMVRGESDSAEIGDGYAQQECNGWWNAKRLDDGAGKMDIPEIFYMKGKGDWVDDRTKDAEDAPGVRDFLYNLSGMAYGSAAGLQAYAIGSFFFFLGFAFIDVITLGAKLLLPLFILMLYGILIGTMWSPGAMKDRLLKTTNKFLGVSVFAGLTSVVITFVVIFTKILINVGTASFGSGTIGAQIWTGVSPLASILIVHFMFTKVFKLPSPVSIRGAQSWGKAGVTGAAGMAVATGAGAAAGSFAGSRLSSMARGAMSQAGRKAVKSSLSKVTGKGGGGSMVGNAKKAGEKKKADLLEKRKTLQDKVADASTPTSRKEHREQQRDAKKLAGLEHKEEKQQNRAEKKQEKVQKWLDRKDERTDFKADRKEARKEHIAETGKAAAGDYLGAVGVGTRKGAVATGRGIAGASRWTGAKIASAGTAVKAKATSSPLGKELSARQDVRKKASVIRSRAKNAAGIELNKRDRRNIGLETAKKARGLAGTMVQLGLPLDEIAAVGAGAAGVAAAAASVNAATTSAGANLAGSTASATANGSEKLLEAAHNLGVLLPTAGPVRPQVKGQNRPAEALPEVAPDISDAVADQAPVVDAHAESQEESVIDVPVQTKIQADLPIGVSPLPEITDVEVTPKIVPTASGSERLKDQVAPEVHALPTRNAPVAPQAPAPSPQRVAPTVAPTVAPSATSSGMPPVSPVTPITAPAAIAHTGPTKSVKIPMPADLPKRPVSPALEPKVSQPEVQRKVAQQVQKATPKLAKAAAAVIDSPATLARGVANGARKVGDGTTAKARDMWRSNDMIVKRTVAKSAVEQAVKSEPVQNAIEAATKTARVGSAVGRWSGRQVAKPVVSLATKHTNERNLVEQFRAARPEATAKSLRAAEQAASAALNAGTNGDTPSAPDKNDRE